MEFLAGNRNAAMLQPHAHRPDLHKSLLDILAAPSLYDQAIRLLARRGLAVGVEREDITKQRTESDEVMAAWAQI